MEQSRIWAHFQDPEHDGFTESEARYSALVARARRHRRAGRALNVGIGGGGVERRLAALGWSVASLDPDPAAVARLRETGVDAREGYLESLPFEPRSFDVAIVSEVLEHLVDDARTRAVAELRRVLRDDGVLIGTVPYRERLSDQKTVCPACGNAFHRWGHVASFDQGAVHALLGSAFRVERCTPRCFVSWRRPITLRRVLKNVAKLSLGRLGEPIVFPSLLFVGHPLQDGA
jgi:SAM-dependent methyltransferase